MVDVATRDGAAAARTLPHLGLYATGGSIQLYVGGEAIESAALSGYNTLGALRPVSLADLHSPRP
ncbi:MAG: hypothetical protein ACLF0G_01650 [Candidatus Brocadiia bacterium]